MQTALKLTTTVLPGHRVEFSAPELPEGAHVEVFVTLPDGAFRHQELPGGFADVMAFLDSLPPVLRTAKEWEALDRELQAERDSWDH